MNLGIVQEQFNNLTGDIELNPSSFGLFMRDIEEASLNLKTAIYSGNVNLTADIYKQLESLSEKKYNAVNADGSIDTTRLSDTDMLGKNPGLYMNHQRLGYWDGDDWKAFIGNTGDAFFGSITENNYFKWDSANALLTVRGDVEANSISSDTIITNTIKGGKTSYSDSTAGYWLGLDGSTPKFNLGNGTNSLKWDGSTLDIKGNMSAGSININNNFTVDSSGNVRGNDFTNKTIFYEKLGSTPGYQDGKMWCEGNPTNKVLWGYFGGDINKQQISTSRMQYSGSFDRTSNTTLSYTTWFQPRLLMFNGFFENIGLDTYGTTNGQAGSVSSNQGFCNAIQLKMTPVVSDVNFSLGFSPAVNSLNISKTDLSDRILKSNAANYPNVTGYYTGLFSGYNYTTRTFADSYSWSYTTTKAFTEIKTASIDNAIGTDSVAKNCYAYVSAWSDTGITIEVVVPSGWRLGGVFTLFG